MYIEFSQFIIWLLILFKIFMMYKTFLLSHFQSFLYSLCFGIKLRIAFPTLALYKCFLLVYCFELPITF